MESSVRSAGDRSLTLMIPRRENNRARPPCAAPSAPVAGESRRARERDTSGDRAGAIERKQRAPRPGHHAERSVQRTVRSAWARSSSTADNHTATPPHMIRPALRRGAPAACASKLSRGIFAVNHFSQSVGRDPAGTAKRPNLDSGSPRCGVVSYVSSCVAREVLNRGALRGPCHQHPGAIAGGRARAPEPAVRNEPPRRRDGGGLVVDPGRSRGRGRDGPRPSDAFLDAGVPLVWLIEPVFSGRSRSIVPTRHRRCFHSDRS